MKIGGGYRAICGIIAIALAVCQAWAAINLRTGFAFAAASPEYTNVLDDLQKDSSFDVTTYPNNPKDYSIQLIQIAESVNGELFVYTYQPCNKSTKIVATEINMSLTVQLGGIVNDAAASDRDNPRLYILTLIDINGVFGKYKVANFIVSKETTRYYNITSIYRQSVKGIDEESGNGNTINAKAYGVGQCWSATGTGDDVKYDMVKVETIEIINPFTSRIRREKGFSINWYYQDNYYIAFSTDRNIDKLLSATVEYRIRDYFYKANTWLGFDSTAFWENSTFGNESRMRNEVYCDEVNELQQTDFNFFFGLIDLNKKFTWERIQSSANFIKNAGASSSDNDEVEKLQWVLIFGETSAYRFYSSGIISKCEEAGQIIDEVTILRLEFVDNGKTYNLGAVSNKVTGDDQQGNDAAWGVNEEDLLTRIVKLIERLFKGITGDMPWWYWLIIGVVVVALIVVIMQFGVMAVIKFIGWIIKSVFKVLWWVISLPFRGLVALKRRGKPKE